MVLTLPWPLLTSTSPMDFFLSGCGKPTPRPAGTVTGTGEVERGERGEGHWDAGVGLSVGHSSEA